jgi:C4-dicarboxylate transporter, DctM subunit
MGVVLILVFGLLASVGMPMGFAMGMGTVAAILYKGDLPMEIIIQRMFGGLDSFPLLAVPFFIMAGSLMDTGGIAARLIRLSQALVGHIRGGLAMVVVVSEVFFSGISGSTVADTAAIGSMMIPTMQKSGYKPPQSAAIVAAAASMGALIPPCIAMVVLGTISSISVGALFAGGFLPAFTMALGLLILIYIQARIGILPGAAGRASLRALVRSFLDAILALLMPVIIFGGILGGITTPTEAAVLAVIYGFILGVFVYKEIKFRHFVAIMRQTLILTGVTMFLVGAASISSWLVSSERIPDALVAAMLSISSNRWVFMLISVGIYIGIGMVLEGLPAVILLVPILLPPAVKLGFNPLHYSIVAIGATYVGLFMPPAGIGLLLSCGMAKVSMEKTARAFTPYLLVLLAGLAIVVAFPEITLFLPRKFFG